MTVETLDLANITFADEDDTPAPASVQFSAREVPWMKLGKLVEGVQTAEEAIKLGGLDFDVEKMPMFFTHNSVGHKIANRMAVVRTDTMSPLGIMSDEYNILQYREAFTFMDAINPEYVAAGALQEGRQGFVVVRAPEHTINVLDGDDPHDLFIVLRTSHDGTRAVEASVMPLREKCMNQMTLGSFSKGVKHRWSIKHTSKMMDKLAVAQDAIKKLDEYGHQYEQLADKLAGMSVTDDQAIKILMTHIFPEEKPRRAGQIESILSAWHHSDTIGKAFDFTGWGFLNAVSEYFDWGRQGGNPESRFTGALQGLTYQAINKTTKQLLQLAA